MPTEIDKIEIIYKFRSWKSDFDKDVLLKNQLYLSSPQDFNDPFDCRISDNYFLLDTDQKISDYVDTVLGRQMHFILSKGLDIDAERKRITEKVADLKIFQKEQDELRFREQDLRYGILSLNLSWDSILMWSHYADHHRGYCLGLYESKLRESGMFGKGGIVNYESKFPALSPFDRDDPMKSFIETHTKAKEWCYEKEYRLTKLFYPEIPTLSDRIVTIPDDFIAEVTIGIDTTEVHRQEIINCCRDRGIRIYSANKKEFEFRIERTEI